MKYLGMEEKDHVTSLYFDLTWNLTWEQIMSFVDVIIKTDFISGGINAVELGTEEGKPSINVTEEMKAEKYHIKDTTIPSKESLFISIAGYSTAMEVPMRIFFWNKERRCVIQVINDAKIAQYGERVYEQFADSIEIMGHIDYTLTMEARKAQEK